jgi:predicted GNAT family acetyltransferase
MSDSSDLTVREDDEHQQFQAVDESGVVAGFAAYEREGSVVTFTHTVVDDAFEGQGVGSRLVGAALDAVRADGLRVVARCPFVSAYVDKHPDYRDLLA